MLTVTDRRKYEQRLRDERRRALRVVEQSLAEQVSDEAEEMGADRASLESERALDQAMSIRESGLVAAIDDALYLLATSPADYGICRECGNPIARGRLDLLPWTRECERHAPQR